MERSPLDSARFFKGIYLTLGETLALQQLRDRTGETVARVIRQALKERCARHGISWPERSE